MGMATMQSIDAIPSEFVWPEDEQPGKTTFDQALDIPIIDLSIVNDASHAICDASREFGMFQVINHNIPKEVIAELQSAGKRFFELSPEEKESYANGKAKQARSYEGYGTNIHKDSEGKKAWSDFLFHNVWPPSAISYDVWPRNPASYRKANEDYASYLLPVVDEIISSLSVGLGLERRVLKDALGGEDLEMLMKINHYPPCPRPDLALGVPAHTDMSAITVLVPNDIPGLQVFKGDHWFDMNYVPGALIIHIGDQIEILSNGRYKAVLHRVRVNKDNVRLSWPVFCSPPAEMVVGPLPQLVSEENPAKFKAKKYQDYQYCKIRKLH
uniref:Flavonol synthase n=1 Tax=Freesia hybrid cultivar TaxID=867926 RepID=A0A7H9SLR7_9ASPA|nr:flavonol synthase [Freesia hybrid cultivar]